MSAKEDYSGTDPKSIAINIATTVLFFSPIAAYFDPEHIPHFGGIVVVAFLIAYSFSPMGWRRPHPYSDDPTNRPPKWQ